MSETSSLALRLSRRTKSGQESAPSLTLAKLEDELIASVMSQSGAQVIAVRNSLSDLRAPGIQPVHGQPALGFDRGMTKTVSIAEVVERKEKENVLYCPTAMYNLQLISKNK